MFLPPRSPLRVEPVSSGCSFYFLECFPSQPRLTQCSSLSHVILKDCAGPGGLAFVMRGLPSLHSFFLFIFKDFIYLFMRDTKRERERQRHRQREKQAYLREADVGLGTTDLGSRPELKAHAQPRNHPSAPHPHTYSFNI